MPAYKRVLLKLSGEALSSPTPDQYKTCGISAKMLRKLALDIASAKSLGVEICVVIGGGNIYRGVDGIEKHGIDRCAADSMGMLATVINGIAMQNALTHANMESRLLSAISMPSVCEPYARHTADGHLRKGRVVVFASGIGNPFFSTDTAAALRAAEMNCDLMLKATKVKGVFCSNPQKNAQAKFFDRISFARTQELGLEVMDATAITLAKENHMPIAVFSIYEPDGFKKVLQGTTDFTLITGERDTVKESAYG